MDISVGAFDPNEDKCYTEVRIFGDEDRSSDIIIGVWVDNVDSRSAMYASAKKEAMAAMKRAVDALEAEN